MLSFGSNTEGGIFGPLGMLKIDQVMESTTSLIVAVDILAWLRLGSAWPLLQKCSHVLFWL